MTLFKWFLAVYLSVGLSLLVSNVSAGGHGVDDSDTLSVRGEAQLMVPPDQVIVSVGVLSEAKVAKKALAINSRLMQQVIDALRAVGITKKEYSTRQLSVQPVWSSRPRNADSRWKSEITGYRVNNNLQIRTLKLDLLGDLINAATSAGANKIQSIQFGLSNPRQHRGQALTQAVENARTDADIAAKAAGVSIKKVKSLQVDYAPSVAHVEKAMVMRSALADTAPVPPVNPGDIAVRASVSIIYELAQ
ncbi:MAG: SIMPL domain-containing protein [Cellvibrionaceae bacterium]